MYEQYINQINKVISDQRMDTSFDTREFFGYILISQIETVESVRQLENKHHIVAVKNQNLEKMVELLTEKCVLLENNIDQLKKLIISSYHSLPLNEVSDLSEKESEFEKNQLVSKETGSNECSNESGYSSCKIDSFDSKTGINCEGFKSDGSCSSHTVDQDHKEIQRLFNKRVKYEVNKKFGSKFLAEHQVRELDVKEMHKIKKKVIKLFSPFPIPIKAAWNNAMNSLRQDRHQLKKRYSSI